MFRDNIKKLIKNDKIILILLSAFIVFIWFRKGIMIATAEEGLPFYSPLRTLFLYSSIFFDSGLGSIGMFNTQRVPLYLVSVLLTVIGFSTWYIQATIYFILIGISLISVSKIVEDFGLKDSLHIKIVASLLYLLNVYTMSQVWTRFVSPLIFLWSYLPLFLFLWIKYLKNKKIEYLIYLFVSTFLFSNAFVILSPFITLVICAGIYFFFTLMEQDNKVEYIKYAFLGIFIWAISCLWWIYPILTVSNDFSTASINSEQNIQSLEEVSHFFPSDQVLTLRQKYMFGENSPYFDFYEQPHVKDLSSVLLVFVLIGLYVSLKNKKTLFFSFLFVFGWFISKGANPPFGEEFYRFLFDKLPFFQVYRNPYEKFGTVFVLAYSILAAIGSNWIFNRARKFKYALTATFLFVFCGYLVLPIWNGQLFKNTTYVIVPDFYETANEYISENSHVSDSRIFQLPFLRSTIINYDWNYYGEEPSEFLFDKASISKTFGHNNSLIYDKLGTVEYFRINKNFTNLLAIMNIEFIILHNDVLTGVYHQENVDDTRKHIENWNNIVSKEKIGKLEVYSLNSEILPGRVYLSENLVKLKDLNGLFDTVTSESFNPSLDVAYISKDSSNDFSRIDLKKPIHKVTKVSSTQYKTDIFNSESPFTLVLANNFSQNWTASIDGEVVNKHFEVNGYANGWVIDKKGDYTIDIRFKVWPWE